MPVDQRKMGNETAKSLINTTSGVIYMESVVASKT